MLLLLLVTAAIGYDVATHGLPSWLGGTPPSEAYCSGIYDGGGRTPSWAKTLFSDYSSCVDWYQAAADDAGVGNPAR